MTQILKSQNQFINLTARDIKVLYTLKFLALCIVGI